MVFPPPGKRSDPRCHFLLCPRQTAALDSLGQRGCGRQHVAVSLALTAELEAGAGAWDLLPGCHTVFAPSMPTPPPHTPLHLGLALSSMGAHSLAYLFKPGFNDFLMIFPDAHHFRAYLPSLGPTPVCRFFSGQELAACALPGTGGLNAG